MTYGYGRDWSEYPELQDRKDMTMEELGKAIGKSQSAVADYEKAE